MAGATIRHAFLHCEWPEDIAEAIRRAYRQLSRRSGTSDTDVAVRSSATAEDLPNASFAGQQECLLNVQGERVLLDACQRCFASLFTDRAISYRTAMGFDHLRIALSIGLQRMVRADLAGAELPIQTARPEALIASASARPSSKRISTPHGSASSQVSRNTHCER